MKIFLDEKSQEDFEKMIELRNKLHEERFKEQLEHIRKWLNCEEPPKIHF